jgi:hypothetical protein
MGDKDGEVLKDWLSLQAEMYRLRDHGEDEEIDCPAAGHGSHQRVGR